MLKEYLFLLNDLLEALACIADEFENEFRMKERRLLDLVDVLVQRHNQIASELRIHPDDSKKNDKDYNHQPNYIKQKNIYYNARKMARQNYLYKLDAEIKSLKQFLKFRNHALIDIPRSDIVAMQKYLKKYAKIICMEGSKLVKYKDYLIAALKAKAKSKAYISSTLEYLAYYCREGVSFAHSQFEFLANYYGHTLHSELMTTLNSRLLYLEKQKIFLMNKFTHEGESFQKHYYSYLNQSEMDAFGTHKVVLRALNDNVNELNLEIVQLVSKSQVTEKPVQIVDNNPKSGESKSRFFDSKDKPFENNVNDYINPRLANIIKIKSREEAIFSAAVKKFESTHSYKPLRDILRKEDCLGPKSVVLIDEVIEALCIEEQKSIQLD
jgi:hypothetical protein